MAHLDPVVDALDQAIENVDSKLADAERVVATEQAEKDRLLAIRASVLGGAVPPASVEPERPEVSPTPANGEPGSKTHRGHVIGASGRAFTKRGWKYVRDIEMALRNKAQTTVRLREIVETTNVGAYLAELEAQGKVRQEGFAVNKHGNPKIRKKTPIYLWIGPLEDDPRAPQTPTADERHVRRPKNKYARGGAKRYAQPISKTAESVLMENYQGTAFTKAEVVKSLSQFPENSVHNALSQIETKGGLKKTGRKVQSPSGRHQIPEWELSGYLKAPDGPGEGEREHRVLPGNGTETGRLRAPTLRSALN